MLMDIDTISKEGEVMEGKLYLCATPIGNLDDITYRAVKILKEVDLIAAEDTRHSMKLLNHYEIKTPITSYHEFNKYDKAKYLVDKMKEGYHIALITDAGTPGISDPGEELVKISYEYGIEVTSIPGPAACINGLILSGLSTRRFAFEAFLPHDKKEKQYILEELKKETRTIILYESPHRLVKTLTELIDVLGNRRVTICRELTKRYETILQTTLLQGISYYKENEVRGEYILVIEGKSRELILEEAKDKWLKIGILDHLEHYIEKGMSKKEAMKAVSLDRGTTKRDIYEEVLKKEKKK